MLHTITKRVQLREGVKAMQQYVFLVLCYPHSSVQFLSQQLAIPVPIISAIKKELKKENIIQTNTGIVLTDFGETLVRQELFLEELIITKYLEVINTMNFEMFLKQYPIVEEIYGHRPIVDVTMDQSKCTLETAFKRALYIVQNQYLLNNTIICIGDDDLISVACCFLYQYMFRNKPNIQVTVMDQDIRILQYIEEVSHTFSLPIRTVHHNLLQPIPTALQHRFDVVITDPPYTKEGYMLFISRGVECLQSKANLPILLSFPKKPLEDRSVMQKFFMDIGLVIEKIEEKFNRYEGAQILGGISDLYFLKTTLETKPYIEGIYQNEIYTHKNNRTIRYYQCMHCKEMYIVGEQRKIKTIEQLKKMTCLQCHGIKFKLCKKEQEKGNVKTNRIRITH